MFSTKTTQEGFSVIGLQIRTTNSKEMSGEGKIQTLWEKFYSEQIVSKVPSRIEDNIYAVYHDYESDASGEYSLTVGLKVRADAVPSNGLHLVHIPPQGYMKFTTDKGQMPTIVIDCWKHIWEKTMQSELNRKYSADFEIYDQRCSDPRSAQLDIYIALNK